MKPYELWENWEAMGLLLQYPKQKQIELIFGKKKAKGDSKEVGSSQVNWATFWNKDKI